MSRYEIGTVFQTADVSRLGKVDKFEWQEFYNNFVGPFEAADKDKDGLLNKEELQDGIKDLTVFRFYIK